MDRQILKNDYLQVEYSTKSLRITGLMLSGKSSMLVELPDLPPINTPFGDFHFQGGHRLWHAPEAMPRTYVPDTELTITDLLDGVKLEAKTEPGTGIQKVIEIHLASDRPCLTVTHTLTNDGFWSVELAPWAITQFQLGGTVILPMPVGNSDAAGLLHNRQLSLWPYARINDPRLRLDDRFVVFKADALLPPFKIGYFINHGWLAYWWNGVLFKKTFEGQTGLPYPDNNCNAEMYCNDQFVELESLGPLVKLAPGESINHAEMWDLSTSTDLLPAEVQEILHP